ncbi:hypothetical protein A2673_02610 [Candidatus Kaiserbacteria bacterium RIFCSPHIGHO2_01_FULL_50_13]|uniref:Phosphoglycerate mutase n=1 Tax=Candidatus Kaiserbacteria bacterium RIFCSPLOWO2_01_FULL_50_24 TaxID=1798507 RepID=A0A1F6ER61_9BACT|nr:MAG: hypothetical protein A2673_02610 [Candidatus Kaiserbacteria bacterium RIFCSPHIGHO2_01_FULL_50_13]OGG76127.1 MAG: hypothetical protein A3A34_00890 [Candidatus Kaiserbacteria bacterium RIFCSPLOWO2_01_FULL_50_24]OGG82342.1 MAG: hypothetical protein A3H74_00030 [Candidatus Kaiserbacteria bacterium RIFCSPLOWO2_02_FULL_51_13]
MVKTIYLMRHGESEDNVVDDNALKGSSALLTERGREQARFVARRCAELDIDVVIGSTYPRAKETADIINERIKKPIEYTDIFVERMNPSEWYGKKKEGAKRLHALDSSLHISGFQHSDEETAEELLARTEKALKYLEDRPESNILLVSHAMFLRAFMARILFREDVTIREIAQCVRVMKLANTGLSILQHNQDDPYGPWRLVCWNDHAHLG